MNGKLNTKRTYKIIACCCIWLAAIVAAFGLACFKSSKVQAGVVIDFDYVIVDNADININNLSYYGALTGGTSYINTIRIFHENNPVYDLVMRPQQYDGATANVSRVQIQYQKYTGAPTITSPYTTCFFYSYNNNVYFMVDLGRVKNDLTAAGYNLENITIERQFSNGFFFQERAYIKPIDNIYDLQQGDVAIIYISDVSGFDSSNYQPEITINWGYIDSSDNTIYAAYSPAVNVMKAPGDLEIWLNIPTDAGGTVYDSEILNQQALLTAITEGGATASANIYAFYVWLLSDRIQWGLLNFNTAGLPASAASMNYFTSYTTKYDYINTNTGTMTCRLSISNNFNFITIKNQPVFSVNTINTTLRQGGLLPAWALYNWARGSAAGYTSGTQAGAAPYQPGGTGYNEIFQAGYDAGLTAQPAASWFEAAFAAVDAFLNIHIFPSITFGELFGIPFIISVVWFIIRMFRGGGSSG